MLSETDRPQRGRSVRSKHPYPHLDCGRSSGRNPWSATQTKKGAGKISGALEYDSRDAVRREGRTCFVLAKSQALKADYLLSATDGPGVAPKSRRLLAAVRAARAAGWFVAAAP